MLVTAISEDGTPLEQATVAVGDRLLGETDRGGGFRIREKVPAGTKIIVDAVGHHPAYITPEGANEITIELIRLPEGNDGRGWWHVTSGLGRCSRSAGQGIRVGVIDSGYRSIPQLAKVYNHGAIFNGVHRRDDLGIDKQGHGTAVASLIGADSDQSTDFLGFAPAAELHVIKLFDKSAPEYFTDTQAEIREAIIYLLDEVEPHLINCSFECDQRDSSLEDVVQYSEEKGALCICASGNHRSQVAFPAAFKPSVAVSALGDLDQLPEGTVGRLQALDTAAMSLSRGSLFVAMCSSRGPEIQCCAPGVGLFVPVLPNHSNSEGYRTVTGTSFATALVTGVLAAALSRDETYRLLTGAKRTNHARQLLRDLCSDLGFPPEWQGHGLAMFPKNFR